MVGRTLGFFVFLFFAANAWSQSEFQFKTEQIIKGKFDAFSVDNFGRIHLVRDDIVIQLSAEYDTLFTTSLKTFFPFSIESRKSFRSLLFDKDRSSVIFLDNTLTSIYDYIDLVQKGIQQPVLVAESFNGNTFWVLDAGNMRLIQMNDKLEIVKQTENLVHLFSSDSEPNAMIEANDYLYIHIPNKGVAVFDIFGTFLKLIPQFGQSIAVLDHYLMISDEEGIHIYDSDNLFIESGRYIIPEDVKQFYFTPHFAYFLNNDGLTIGKFLKKNE